jgi:hypothetical protein
MPREFVDAVELDCAARKSPPSIGWGISLAVLPVMLIYWVALVPLVLGTAVVQRFRN